MAGTSSRNSAAWSQAPSMPAFPGDRIDVWKVCLDEPLKAPSETEVLSAEERARAERFLFEKDKIHFTRCRSALRFVLAAYLAIPADAIRFEYMPRGKPQLVAEQNPRALQFSVSHSVGVALIVVGSKHRLGIDIERIRADVDTAAIAERFFSLRERARLRALPDRLRVPGFYACWTRKEAFLKATGDGLSFPLADFSVTVHPDLAPELEEVRGSAEAHKHWFLSDLSVVDGYRAAVAIDNAHSHLKTYAWN